MVKYFSLYSDTIRSLSAHSRLADSVSSATVFQGKGWQWKKYFPPIPSSSGDVATWIDAYAPWAGVFWINTITGVDSISETTKLVLLNFTHIERSLLNKRMIKFMFLVTSVLTTPGWTQLQVTPHRFSCILFMQKIKHVPVLIASEAYKPALKLQREENIC